MKKTSKVIIWGTGSGAQIAIDLLDLEKVDIIAHIDNDQEKQGKYFNDVKIIRPLDLQIIFFDYIIVGSMFYDEIYAQLKEMKVSEEKIVKVFDEHVTSAKHLAKQVYDENTKYINLIKKEHLKKYFRNYAVCNMNVKSSDRNIELYNYPDYLIQGIDFIRVSTLELISKEIRERQVQGNIAELGVYKGDFTKAICNYFPERKIYLFDTFEGFMEEDISIEQKGSFSKAIKGHLKDTNVELVLKKIDGPENCIIKKGYFPETAKDIIHERFAFVSIDTDLYKPTYEGLKFFYDRLNFGGYILIHDYNHEMYLGVKEAVRRFCNERQVNYFPLSDFFGSAVIIK